MLFLRSLAFYAYYYLISSYILIFYGTWAYLNPTIALDGFRAWCKLIVWGLHHLVKINIQVRGAEYIPVGGALVASKHQSTLETILIFGIMPSPCAILKHELTYIPFAQAMIKGAGHIPVKRSGNNRSKVQIIKQAKKLINDNRQVVIYPEGTRSKVNSTPTYKRGVHGLYHHLRQPCIPMAVNTGMFWAKEHFLIHAGTVIIEFLEPIDIGLDADIFMNTLTTRIESATARLVHEAAAEQAKLRS